MMSFRMPHVLTARQPQVSFTPLTLRYGDSDVDATPLSGYRRGEYGTVAHSLRSLRSAPLAHPPSCQAIRPSWLRCERVTQRVITTGRRLGG